MIHRPIKRRVGFFQFDTEKKCFDAGDTRLAVAEVRGMRVGLMICFDWAFPEVARVLALKGADLICHPANLVLAYCQKAILPRFVGDFESAGKPKAER